MNSQVTKFLRYIGYLPGRPRRDQLLKELHSFEGRTADIITSFSGSMPFVYFHIVWFGLWVLINKNVFAPHIPSFDPFPYGLLTMLVSLEAIFLSTFIMISQNRQALVDTYRVLEEEKEQKQEEMEQEELEEEVEDIQKDLDDIKSALSFIQTKIAMVEKIQPKNGGSTPASTG